MPDKHAFLSPSSAERWFHCPPSAWLSEQFPDLGSVFAAEGTEAHRLCEFLLHEMLDIPDVDPRPGLTYYTEEMEEAARGYAQFISERLEKWKALGQSPEVFVEQRVDLKKEIMDVIGEVKDLNYRLVLEKRHLCFESWPQIGDEMGHTDRWARLKHEAALRVVQQILDKREAAFI